MVFTMPFKIGIIGAGPAGLVTALGLEEYCKSLGSEVEIVLIDKNKSAFDYPGVEYGIQKRACLALRRIGIKDQALAKGLPNKTINFFNARTNQMQKQQIKTDPELTVTVVRQEFLGDLTNMLQHTVIKRELNVFSVSSTANNVTVSCKNTNNETETYDFDMLISADGIGSVTRKEYFKDQNYIHNQGFSSLYMLIEVPQEAPENIKKVANNGESFIVLGKTCTATFFSLGKNRLAVGIGFDDQVRQEIWDLAGADEGQQWPDLDITIKLKIAEILSNDCAFQDNMLKKAFQWVPDWNSYKIYLWRMRDSDVIKCPYNNNGNIILIGDAAHAIMPTIGMGASLAIEDAEMLAKYISKELLSNNKDLKKSLANYSFTRMPVWNELMGRARAAAKLNFVGIRNRNRFGVGPQIPVKYFWRLIAKVEELIN
jgi:salicylate hydroxylase